MVSRPNILRRTLGVAAAALVFGVAASPQFRAFMGFPQYLRLPVGSMHQYNFRLPVMATVAGDTHGVVAVNGGVVGQGVQPVKLSTPLHLDSLQLGTTHLNLKLFGWIPFRQVTVDVVPPYSLRPGGQAIGVLVHSQGVLVVGYADVNHDGGHTAPGRSAGVEVGDAIVEINGQPVADEERAATLVEESGRLGNPVRLTIRRRGKLLDRTIVPLRDEATGRWRIGLYVRDGTAGVGTLTFYDPGSGTYGALGHVIADGDTGQPIPVSGGRIVRAAIVALQKSTPGHPGEKVGTFVDEGRDLGTIGVNGLYGIYGRLAYPGDVGMDPGIPVALSAQVHEGTADILTVLHGQQVQRFRAEITRVLPRGSAGKDLILHITDPRLLEQTGGIVQGMSGSPILQGGRLVGAVTHVFVNDPSRGYGVFAEHMLQEAGLMPAATGAAPRIVHAN